MSRPRVRLSDSVGVGIFSFAGMSLGRLMSRPYKPSLRSG
jgi:hypothetical protein